MQNIYYIQQAYHDITIFNSFNQIVMYAKRNIDWLGKIHTTIDLNSGQIVGTFYSNIFYKNFKVAQNTTSYNMSFEKSKKLIVDNYVIQEKNDSFLKGSYSIFINDTRVLKIHPINFFSTNFKLKIEIINNHHDIQLAFIYILLTLDILIS